MGVDVKIVFGDFEFKNEYGKKYEVKSDRCVAWYIHRETEVLNKPQFFVYCTKCMKYNTPSYPETYRRPIACYKIRCWTCQNKNGLELVPIPIWVWISTESKQSNLVDT